MADRIYVVDSYWAADYVGYQADAVVEVTPYFEEGYFDPTGYYETRESWAQVDVTAIRIRLVDSGLIEFTGAFTPILTADAIKNTFAVLDSNSSVSVTADRFRSTVVDFTSAFEQSTTNDRVRYVLSDLSSQFTTDITAEKIQGGVTVEASGAWSSAFNITSNVSIIISFASDLTVTSTTSLDGNRLRDVLSSLDTNFAQLATNSRIRLFDAGVNLEFTQTAQSGRIQEASASITGAFSPSMTANAVRNTFAVLDTTSALAIGAIANRSASVTLSSIVTQSLQGMRLRGYAANVTAQSDVTADNSRTRNDSVVIVSAFALDVTYNRIRRVAVSTTATFAQTTINDRVRYSTGALTAQFTQTSTVNEITQLAANISGAVTQTALVGVVKQFQSDEYSLFSPAFTVNAITNTFAVLDSVATVNVTAVTTPKVTATLNTTASLTATVLRIKDFTATPSISGVQFNGNDLIYIQDGLLGTSESPQLSSKFAISFWAQDASGTVIDTFTGDNPDDWGGNFEFIGNTLKFTSYMNDQNSPWSYSNVTWTVPDTTGWHHYLIDYEVVTPQINPPTSAKRNLYVDGVLVSSPSVSRLITPGGDGKGPGPDSIALYWGSSYGSGQPRYQLGWALGGDIYDVAYSSWVTESTLKRKSDKSYTGGLTQVAVWYDSNTPNFANSTQRSKVYDGSFVDLGEQGTTSGLVKPNMYFRLNSAFDITQRGSNTLTTQWKEQIGNNYVTNYTPLTTDTIPGNLRMVASMLASTRASNSGFVDTYLVSSLTATGLRVKTDTATLNSQVTLTVTAEKFRDTNVALTSNFAQTVDNSRTRLVSADVTAQATITSTALRIQALTADLTAQASVTANNVRTRDHSASVDAQFALESTALRIKQLSADLQVQGFELATISRIGNTLVDCSSEFALTVTATSGVDSAAHLEATTAQTTQVIKTTDIDETYSAVFDVDISIDKVRNFNASLTVNANISCTPSKTTDYSATLNSIANINAITDNSKVVNPGPAQFESEFVTTLTADLFKDFSSSISSTVNQLTIPVKTVRPQLQFDSIATELVSGQALSYDRNLTIKIKRETKNLLVLQEPRTIELVREYRALQILEENTILPVHSETRVNMVRTQ